MTARPIKSVFYRHDLTPITNSGCDPKRAVGQAVTRMQSNDYNAHTCEVYDSETGLDYASVRWTVDGRLEVVFKRPEAHPTSE